MRNNLPKLGLPSPQATIAASQKSDERSQPPRASAKRTQPAGNETSAAVKEALSRGRAQEQAGQLDQARKTYEGALASHPASAPLLHRLGVVADRQKKHGEAEQFFVRALELSPGNAILLGDLGYCYFLQGKLDEAQAALSQAVARDPKNSRQRNNLGLVLGHQQDYDAAFEQFAAAGSEADAFYNMAFVFASQDLPDEAKGCFQEAIAADPSHELAREALASFEAYDRSPADDRDEVELASGVRYVPYVEPEGANEDGSVEQASATTNLPAGRDVGSATRALQLKSRGLLTRHMQQERSAGSGRASSGQSGSLPPD